MNLNTASQNNGILAWRAVSASDIQPGIDIRRHVNFSFTFEVVDDVTVDAVFEFGAAPPSDADPCVPGVWYPVNEVLTCVASWGLVPARTQLVIPAGTKQGAICTATLPCRPDAFVNVQPKSGDTGMVQVVAILSGPR
jgi:hypothetical protein